MTKRILGGLIAVAFLAFPAGVATGQQSKANRPATKASEKNGKDVEANVSEGDDISKDQSENEKSPEMDKSSGVVRPFGDVARRRVNIGLTLVSLRWQTDG
jgi:hypothetical protein